MKLDKDKIHLIQKNRGQFLMIDYVDDLVIGESAKGAKELNDKCGFLKYTGQVIQICPHHYNWNV